MSHIALEEWMNYARDEMDDNKRTEYEEHLYSCDQCMSLYMEAIEAVQDELPSIEGPSLFTEEMMERIPVERDPVMKPVKKQWYEEKVFHYVLATAMTLILMASGIFGELSKITTEFEKVQQSASFTENILNKTTALLDSVEEIEEQEAE
ncbi:anti-sigma factor family protein [Rossellomorea sp. NRS-1567]|uniref:anti-sigma factor family protein n=1 Tax=Rossellomorea sp. NRS-1567 TaxID=3233901 RepID=UPI003D2C6245